MACLYLNPACVQEGDVCDDLPALPSLECVKTAGAAGLSCDGGLQGGLLRIYSVHVCMYGHEVEQFEQLTWWR